ncbi:MAG: hypothetical protein A2Z52_00900 [Candidatus Moranbacteria bacterium RBG_19FT_COMBO_42_6]|nr:MAG: hypothetical protein A2Z52_00900 [Candidatus Moranbacteria bacterium RBG_19FT_COMBO_42_6]
MLEATITSVKPVADRFNLNLSITDGINTTTYDILVDKDIILNEVKKQITDLLNEMKPTFEKVTTAQSFVGQKVKI